MGNSSRMGKSISVEGGEICSSGGAPATISSSCGDGDAENDGDGEYGGDDKDPSLAGNRS